MMGQFILGLFAGIVVGLVMEWVIDWTGLFPKATKSKPTDASGAKPAQSKTTTMASDGTNEVEPQLSSTTTSSSIPNISGE